MDSRRALATLAVAVVAVGTAVLGARALDDPVGPGGRDPAPAMPAAAPVGNAGTTAGLPPLALVPGLPERPGAEGRTAAEQLDVLRPMLGPDADADLLVELGSVLQSLGRGAEAQRAYEDALERDPDNLAARIGLILVPAAVGGPGALDTADAQLAAIEEDMPREQLITFNRAWVAIYRGAPVRARRLLERTVDLGAGTRLGVTASTLLSAFDAGRGAAPARP